MIFYHKIGPSSQNGKFIPAGTVRDGASYENLSGQVVIWCTATTRGIFNFAKILAYPKIGPLDQSYNTAPGNHPKMTYLSENETLIQK
jgi:hypothetical protein